MSDKEEQLRKLFLNYKIEEKNRKAKRLRSATGLVLGLTWIMAILLNQDR